MKKYLLGLLFITLIPLNAQAASLSLDSAKQEYGLGDSFTVNISLDIDDVCVNTVETKITFPPNLLYLEDFVSGESLINVWVEQPSEAEILDSSGIGEIYIAGGIPGGYCGKIPGDPGESNLVGRLLFRIPGFYVGEAIPETLNIKLEDAKVYVNDGLGTEDRLKTKNLSIKLNKNSGTEAGDYDAYIKSDSIKPEPFVIELHQSDNIFQGQYFAIFSSIDKQSGIDHYEILESAKQNVEKTLTEKLIEFFKESPEAEWEIAKTPQLLKDQSLRSIIRVKAVDRAGNERSVEYIPEKPNTAKVVDFDYLIIGAAVLILLIIAFLVFIFARYIYRKLKSMKAVEEEMDETEDLENKQQ